MGEYLDPFGQLLSSVQGLTSSKEFEGFCFSSSNTVVTSSNLVKKANLKTMKIEDSESNVSTESNTFDINDIKSDQNQNISTDEVSRDGAFFTSGSKSVKAVSVAGASDETSSQNEESFSDEESFFDGSIFGSSSTYLSSLSSSIFEEKTLSQMAAEFRSQNPDKWNEKEEERKKRMDGSSSKTEKIDSFLDDYYARQSEIAKEKKEKELQSKLEVK